MIYADNAATTKISDKAFEKMLPYLQGQYGNASSQYSLGIKARQAVKSARDQVAVAIGAEPSEITFTSGGSEGNNWVLQNFPTLFNGESIHIVTSAIEHPSVLNTCRILEKRGVSVTYLPVDSNGCVSVAAVQAAIRTDTKLVSLMTANNETGAIQPISKIGKLLCERGIFFHTDAVQAVGHIPVNVKELNIDFLTASAHKFNGAKGTGFLYVRAGLNLPQLIFGGEQEQGKRAGTENVAGIVALACALEESLLSLENERERQKLLVKATATGIREVIPDIIFNAEKAQRLPGVLSLTFPQASGEAMMHLLDLKGICVSTSSACSSGKDDPSHVLIALGLSEKQAKSSIRISFGRYNRPEDANIIVSAIESAYKKIREVR